MQKHELEKEQYEQAQVLSYFSCFSLLLLLLGHLKTQIKVTSILKCQIKWKILQSRVREKNFRISPYRYLYIFINYYHNTVKQVQLSYSYFKDKETEAQKERILLKVTQLLTVRIGTGIQTDLIPSFIVFYCYKYLIGGDHCKGRYN